MHNNTNDQASLQAEASSAHSRINVPLNLENWKHLHDEVQSEMMWFHQWLLDNKIGWDEAAEALGYDRSTVFRLLKGTYQAASWDKPIGAIKSFRRIAEHRGTITTNEFRENGISRLIWAGLDYAMANNSITTIIGESRQGKTISTKAWAAANNHGRSVFVTAPPVGGTKMLLRVIAGRVGINKGQNMIQLAECLHRAFNKNRILIVDEAHRLMPNDTRTVNPASIELLRDLHDQTGCALAVCATFRFSKKLESGSYQFEQFIGRVGMPIRLPENIKAADVLPIVKQFLTPGAELMRVLTDISNHPGRLGIVTESLKVASRIAAKAGQKLADSHVLRAIEVRKQMSGTSNQEGKSK